jgi:hypothetical protein
VTCWWQKSLKLWLLLAGCIGNTCILADNLEGRYWWVPL